MPKHTHYTLTKIQKVKKHNRTPLRISVLMQWLQVRLLVRQSALQEEREEMKEDPVCTGYQTLIHTGSKEGRAAGVWTQIHTYTLMSKCTYKLSPSIYHNLSIYRYLSIYLSIDLLELDRCYASERARRASERASGSEERAASERGSERASRWASEPSERASEQKRERASERASERGAIDRAS